MNVGNNPRAHSNRKLSDNNILRDNSLKRKESKNELRYITPPVTIDINIKDYRQRVVEDILSVVKKHIDDVLLIITKQLDNPATVAQKEQLTIKKTELITQRNNLYSLVLCLSGILHNRKSYKIFKDIDFNSFTHRVAKYISNYIPSLNYLGKSLKKVAYDLIRICDNPKVKPGFIQTLGSLHEVVMFRRNLYDMFDTPKYEAVSGIKLTKYAQAIVDYINMPTRDRVNPHYIKRSIVDNFSHEYYSKKANSILFHIWDMNKIRLNKAYCAQVNLLHITLQDMTMNKVDFQATSFKYAMLMNVTFTNCDFRRAYFDESILKNVKMINCRLEGATFDNAIINDSEISIRIPKDLINSEIGGNITIEEFLQHKHCKGFKLVNHFSILTTIDSIQGIYPELKVELVNQVIEGIWRGSRWQHIDFFDDDHYVIKSFVDILMQESSIYIQDENIKHFMLEAVLAAKIKLANKQKEKFNKQEVVLLIRNIAMNISSKVLDNDTLVENLNSISQLLYWTRKHMPENTVMLPYYDIVHKATFAAAGFADKYKEYNSAENKCYIITNENKRNKIFAFLGEINFGKLFKEGYNSVTWDEVMYSADGSNGEDGSEAQILGDKAETVLANFALFKSDFERWLNVQKTHMTKGKITRHTII